MKKLLTFLLTLFFVSSSFAKSNVEIVAVVGDDAISTIDVKNRLNIAIVSSGLKGKEDIEEKLRPQILQLLIDESLYAQEAKKLDIEATEEDMANAISALEERNNIKPGGFNNFLTKQGLSVEAVKEQLSAQILWNKIVGKKISPRVVITDRELDEKIEQISNNSGMAELDISEISLPVENPKEEARIRDLAQKLARQIRNGANFFAVAKEFSRSNTAAEGGNLGWVPMNSLSEDVASKLRNLRVGDITGAFKTEDGYKIIKLNDRRALVNVESENSTVSVKQAMVRFDPKADKEERDRIVAKIEKQKNAVKSCNDFSGFAKNIKSVADTNMIVTKLKDLNPGLKQVLGNMRIGDISPVSVNPESAYLFMLCAKGGNETTLVLKNRVKDMLMRRKIELQAQRYMRNLRRNTFIEIRA